MDIWFTLFVMLAAVLVAVGGALLLVSHLQLLPAAFDHGWRVFLMTLLFPFIGPLWFVKKYRAGDAKALWQLVAGLLLVFVAGVLLMGLGPYFVERIMANGGG